MLNIVVAFDEAFAPHASAMLASCLEYNVVRRVFAVVGGVDSATIERFSQYLVRRGVECIVIEMDRSDLGIFPVFGHVSAMTYARLFASDFLPLDVKRALYLDCDLIVRDNIEELWRIDLKGCSVACVFDAAGEHASKLGMSSHPRYFNAGVMLWDVAQMRSERVLERARAFLQEHPERIVYWDQDALNVSLEGAWREMPARWNARFRPHAGGRWISNLGDGETPAIVHFDGAGLKPWQVGPAGHPYRFAYTRARWRSAWPFYADPAWVERPRQYATRVIKWGVRRARAGLGA